MTVSEAIVRTVVTARPRDSLATVAGLMQEHNVGTVVIVENRKPVGIVTDRDLALALGARAVSPGAPVEDVMSTKVRTIRKDAGIFTATRHMRDCEVRRLPIVDEEDRLIGMVALDDLLRLLARELFNLAQGIEHEMEVK